MKTAKPRRGTMFVAAGMIACAMLFVLFIVVAKVLEVDCWGPDTNVFLDTCLVDGRRRIAVLRTTGFQDRVQFLDLFIDSVSFDACGRPRCDPLHSVMVFDCPDSGLPAAVGLAHDSLFLVCTKEHGHAVETLDELRFR